ncbi:KES1-like protein 1 [Elsinoe australis]|uniref:KES1-like protein 1 n=1 Tax=Elsinoe australis TaxID=40998 RepID=A0A4U7BF97_9PEZI|nr:KES1-like protein 1 [Elsinoe australis]
MATSEPSQRSALKDFLGSIATIKGDLSNITAPPFVLSTQSTTELPSYWAEYPSIFVAPALCASPQDRALLVLKWFLSCLRRQQYGGRPESEGVKKPLNAFLGELFVASFPSPSAEGDSVDVGETKLISEQVSHHPPVTACCLWNEAHGVRAEGYAAQKITFNGAVNVKQMGHAVLTLEKWNESYLIPLPAVKVSGILSGAPYPELGGHYQIVSSGGYICEIDFSGKRVLGFGGEKHHVHAAIFKREDEGKKDVIYEIEGAWNGEMVVKDGKGEVIDSWNVQDLTPVLPQVPKEEEQSPYESRRAWAGVIKSLNEGNMQGVVDAKSKIEEAQRSQRKKNAEQGKTWQPLFFKKVDRDEQWERLTQGVTKEQTDDSKVHGFWKFDKAAEGKTRPFREGAPWEP